MSERSWLFFLNPAWKCCNRCVLTPIFEHFREGIRLTGRQVSSGLSFEDDLCTPNGKQDQFWTIMLLVLNAVVPGFAARYHEIVCIEQRDSSTGVHMDCGVLQYKIEHGLREIDSSYFRV